MNTSFRSLLMVLAVALSASTSFVAEAAPPIQVTAADPASAPQGITSLDVAVTGSGFDSSAAVAFLVTGTTNSGGITVKRVTVSGSKKLIATIDVSETAVVASFDIQVTQSGGRKGKGTSLFAVQKVGSALEINPAFTLDSKQQYKFKVVRLNADGTAPVTLTNPLVSQGQPRWSPDGRSILYFDRLSMLLVRMDSRSGTIEGTIPSEPYGPGEFDWSNDNVDACEDLIVYAGSRDLGEVDLFVANSSLSSSKQLVMAHDVDDALTGNVGDPDTNFPAWSPDGRHIATYSTQSTGSGPRILSLIIYSTSCSNGIDVRVDGEVTLALSFGLQDYWWNGFSWNSDGRYLAMTVADNADTNLWIADLGDPSQAGYPSATPTLYRLTGSSRPFGVGAERVVSASFAPATDTIAFTTQLSGSEKNDNLYTINAGICMAAIAGNASISTACAPTLIAKGINGYGVDWRPNWPTPLH